MEEHNKAVKAISATVKDFHNRKEKFRINHGSTNSTRPRDHQNAVNVSHLNHIIKVDVEKKVVLVEPNVPMDRLVEGTLSHGLVPAVVMEFPGITVGGGYSGTSGESSSFKHGFFDRIINFVEMILADGSVVRCSRTEKPDLFNGAAGALGTLGITTLVELQLVTATTYVETSYIPVASVEDALEKTQVALQDSQNDYIDGILFSQTSGAIITGRMTNDVPVNMPVQTFSRAWDPWFYLHVQERIKSGLVVKEVVPLAEYLFRYDRGGFWVGASAFKYFYVPFNKLTRWFLDDFLHTRMMYTALHASGQSRQYVVQDLAIPYEGVKEFIDYTTETFDIWPLWLCPLKTPPTTMTMHPHVQSKVENSTSQTTAAATATATEDKMLNVGLWGFGPQNFDKFVTLNKNLEHKLQQLGGIKWLYAHTYYTEEEFWQVYDKKWYDILREKYNATGLPDVFSKVAIDIDKERKLGQSWMNRFVFSSFIGGFYGVWKAIQSRSYIAARASTWKWEGVKNGAKEERNKGLIEG